jgi:polygalacturonase
MRNRIVITFSIVFLCLISFNTSAQYDIRKFGAKGDGTTLDTRSIQSAIDKANDNGGGTVEITPEHIILVH